jgi:hypothetical protein
MKDKIARVAIHEAGHAVVGWRSKMRITRVTIVPTADALGSATHHRTPAFLEKIGEGRLSNERVEAVVQTLLAGPEAERKFCGRYDHQGASADYDGAHDYIIRHVGSDDEGKAWVKLCRIRTRARIAFLWDEIVAVAEALEERKTVKGSDLPKIIERLQARQRAATLKKFGLEDEPSR